MRLGSFARGLLLKGECEVDLVLMTASKPDGALFIQLSNQLPAKFEVQQNCGQLVQELTISPDVFVCVDDEEGGGGGECVQCEH